MRFSIIIPSFNSEKYIAQALQSVEDQQYDKVEVILIDGGSTDRTLEIAKSFKCVKKIVSEPDKGQSDALNKGFALATGDIFYWLNSDDTICTGALNTVVYLFSRYPEKTVCYGNWKSIDAQGRTISEHFAMEPATPRFSYENIKAYNQSIFWKSSVHKRFPGFDIQLSRLMDDDFILWLLLNEDHKNWMYCGSFLGNFRIHGEQKTTAVMDERHLEEEKLLEKKYSFTPADSFQGKYFRLQYRFRQLFNSLKKGGMLYTFKYFLNGLRKRGGLF